MDEQTGPVVECAIQSQASLSFLMPRPLGTTMKFLKENSNWYIFHELEEDKGKVSDILQDLRLSVQ